MFAAVAKQGSNGQVQIDLGGRSFPIQASNLSPGQTVLIRLASSVNLNSLSQSPPAPSAPAASPARAPLTQAEVVASQPNGQYTIVASGKTINVLASEPLTVGTTVLGRIETTSNGPVLELDAPEEVSQSEVATAILQNSPQRSSLGDALQALLQGIPRLLTAAGDNPALTSSIERLGNSLSQLLSDNESSPSPQRLAQFVQDGGLQYEAKLARLSATEPAPELVQRVADGDLKGQLLSVLSSARSTQGADGDSHPLELVRQALSQIEGQQAVNLVAKSAGEPYQIQMPLANPGAGNTLYLSVDKDDSQGSGRDGPSGGGFGLLMHLDLSETGATWIDAQIAGLNLKATLYVETPSGREAARASLSDLADSLHGLGFGNVLLDVRSTAELPRGEEAGRFHALESATPESISLVDRRA